ncbi:hypothetical protein AVEN_241217-1 [Araneus ventricosus]|uniref:Uncharacterized protein n=1 Tax=Araneus ventricosus TaxID=182803 RepID=A0A4Y2CZQ1_ARAVE|nr:hypothetical protein AVEN_241217-1 [Araneus ventricosus]
MQIQQRQRQQRIRQEIFRTSELPDYRVQRLCFDKSQHINRRQTSMRLGLYLEAFRYDPTKDYWLHPKAAFGKMNVIFEGCDGLVVRSWLWGGGSHVGNTIPLKMRHAIDPLHAKSYLKGHTLSRYCGSEVWKRCTFSDSSSSSVDASKLRGQSQNNPCVSTKRDVEIKL